MMLVASVTPLPQRLGRNGSVVRQTGKPLFRNNRSTTAGPTTTRSTRARTIRTCSASGNPSNDRALRFTAALKLAGS